ncbi:hypothetical protein FALBO_9401 [Fusarium albosuccineum]|uniref:Uncharacterized protein n=1 Tax=Fusarium albosuccineum TaxID=1237068 RepID=A0A8H4L9X8_9HYPO|nr:hypothetical protein FALBO_9401 [Fusarium albosuccineum]KAF4986456.1 hypothetical protein FDECE_15943 [Fusarium decemcellulare]
MQFKQLIVAAAVALGAGQVAATVHGELGDHNGLAIRWHQLAKGVYTGVPAHKWDDKVHKIVNEEWDVDEIMAKSHPNKYNVSLSTRDIEERNLRDNCQAVFNCVKYGGQAALLTGINTWITLADYAKGGTVGKDLMDFLNQPFVANAAGVAIAGVISGQINEATKSECSTSGSEADVIGAAVNAALAQNPDAEDVSVQVNGPSGSWTITVNAGKENSNPPATC